MNKKLTQEEFIAKAQTIHGDKYNYEQTIYINSHTKIKIICNHCKKIFSMAAYSHTVMKQGCKDCGNAAHVENRRRTYTNLFLQQAIAIHNNKYDYSDVVYTGTDKKVII